ncbi:MAG: hypothetical protein B6I32_01745 [Desulfobacterium sp. 4572_20]|nr:MAG: hypothetical protein B6I32_01745 [Desulfobacterium sp. 4572_20]
MGTIAIRGLEHIPGFSLHPRGGDSRPPDKAQKWYEKMDYYYLSGSTQNGILFVPIEGKPLLMVKREVERALLESPLEEVVELGCSSGK